MTSEASVAAAIAETADIATLQWIIVHDAAQNATYVMVEMDLLDDLLDDLLYDKKYAPEAPLQQKVFDVLLKVFA